MRKSVSAAAVAAALSMFACAPADTVRARATELAVEFIEKRERFVATRYRDQGGKWTIGFGHLWKEGDPMVVTLAQAREILRRDLADARAVVDATPGIERLNAHQYAACYSFAFNVGGERWIRSSVRRAIKNGELHNVPAHMIKYVYYHDQAGKAVRSNGLENRRHGEIDLFNKREN